MSGADEYVCTMARNLRDTKPGVIHLLGCRTVGAELLMVPSAEMNEIISGILARYAERYRINIYAYAFLSNHYHIVASAGEGGEGALSLFGRCLNRELAKRVNRHLKREGHLWAQRFSGLPTIEPIDALEGLLYTTTNPTKHAMVTHPKSWPGVGCYWQLLEESEKTCLFTNYTKYHAALRRAQYTGETVRKRDYQTEHKLKLTPIPTLRNLTTAQRRAKLEELLEKRRSKLYREHKKNGVKFKGRRAILEQPRQGTFPHKVSKATKPSCYSKNPAAIKAFEAESRIKRSWYRKASIAFRKGIYTVVFPPFCFKPTMYLVPP